ncbi:hypothetical protein pEaSNUABM5_00342 [Erwinia phage pEa_SNUABM_5]|uniref:Uncharacterized protein n=1 Tax=Erwinia phage pEa_SNUABM_5 TaxID=2797313 RepID=A0A7T8IWD4_9CAUD|nr:hypothetical protein MPK73_gp342 [Erwinia phage pEa_SNUABM_5]QQO90484.1 hypothetical protein pEaSNUABM5_00342 [Erwinia phage pEa_SNUABM_5]
MSSASTQIQHVTPEEVERRRRLVYYAVPVSDRPDLIEGAKRFMSQRLEIPVADVREGLVCHRKNGQNYVLCVFTRTGPLFLTEDGEPYVSTYANFPYTFDLTVGEYRFSGRSNSEHQHG